MQRLIVTGLLLLVTIIWGWTFTVVHDAVEHDADQADPTLWFLALRFGLAALVLGSVQAARGGRTALQANERKSPGKKGSMLIGALVGAVLATAYFLQTQGLVYTSPTNSGLITGLFVITAPLIGWLFCRTPVSRATCGAAGAALVGLYLLVGLDREPLTIGDLLTLGCAFAFGLHIVLLDRWSQERDTGSLAAWQIASAALFFYIAAAVTSGSPLPETWPTTDVWIAILITGVLATAACFWIQTFAQQRLTGPRVAIILIMEPFFATLFGCWLNEDRLNGWQWCGAVIMFGAMVVAELSTGLGEESEPFA